MSMKKIKSLIVFACMAAFTGCADFMDPLPHGNYTDKNYKDYPSLIRGFIDKGYSLFTANYNNAEFIGFDYASDDAVHSSSTIAMRTFANGTINPSGDPFATYWSRNYRGINYANNFLKDDLGISTRYLVNSETNELLQRCLQGDAYALRAWFQYDLLKKFGGRGTNGELLGFPIMLEPTEASEISPDDIRRDSFDDCVEQIIKDCDKALEYLPIANRDFMVENTQHLTVVGSIRYRTFDQMSVKALKAMTYLLWASPAYNPDNDITRWELAAEAAAEVMKMKMDIDGRAANGFDPAKRFLWTDPNSPEIIFASKWYKSTSMEQLFYPVGFYGKASVGPTQELVDAFPMLNGYPITHPESGYNPEKPYEGRDPRFYATIFYNGAPVVRPSTNEIMYTFETYQGGKDQAGLTETTLTNYYFKKHIYMGWNHWDSSPEQGARCIFYLRWTSMCLAFAEAANRAVGPNVEIGGFTAKQALEYLRNRPTTDNTPGIGSLGPDNYLEECAADPDKFEELVRNEWRIETCAEGQRFFNLRRWGTSLKELNKPVRKVLVTKEDDGSFTYRYEEVDTRDFPSQYLPIPAQEMRRAKNIVQNEGWEGWK